MSKERGRQRKPLGVDTRRGTRLDNLVSKFTGGRLGVETSVTFHEGPYIDSETGERLYPATSKVSRKLIKT